jgi:hypothetical protein
MVTGTPIPNLGRARSRWARTGGWRILLWFCLLWGGSQPPVHAQSVTKEYQLKAAFLYNFTKFIEWPPQRFATPTSPIIIGVLGDNPFGAELMKAVADRTQNGHTFVVTNLASINDATAVHLLFVPRGGETQLKDQLPELHAAGVLTVGENEAFATMAGIITFSMEADKIRFEVNMEAAERAGLKVSSKLLQLAKVVRRKPAEAQR